MGGNRRPQANKNENDRSLFDLNLIVRLPDKRLLCNRFKSSIKGNNYPWKITHLKYRIKCEESIYLLINKEIRKLFGIEENKFARYKLDYICKHEDNLADTEVYLLKFESLLNIHNKEREFKGMCLNKIFKENREKSGNFNQFSVSMLSVAESLGKIS